MNGNQIRQTIARNSLAVLESMPSKELARHYLYSPEEGCRCYLGAMWGLENDLFEDDYNIEAHQVSETLVKSWFPEAYKNRGTSPDHRDILNALESVVEANDAYTGSPNGRWEHVVQYLRSWL